MPLIGLDQTVGVRTRTQTIEPSRKKYAQPPQLKNVGIFSKQEIENKQTS